MESTNQWNEAAKEAQGKVLRHWSCGVSEAAKEALPLMPKSFNLERGVLKSLAQGLSAEDTLRRLPRQLLMLYVKAAQSRLFNEVLSRRVGHHGCAPRLGDLALPVTAGVADLSHFSRVKSLPGQHLVLNEDTLPMVGNGLLEVVLPLPGTAVQCPPSMEHLYEEASKELLGIELKAFSTRLPLDLPLEGVYRPAVVWLPRAMEVDDDDDWNPVVRPTVVLRPHILQWSGEGPKEGQGAREILEADPLHDPEADDEDQKWVEDQLLQPDQSNIKATDAVLNCPGCFTPVCYQCQRHEQYSGQWRATEVRNCAVDTFVAFAMSKDDPTKYHAVRCEVCKADVGLLDMDGIYHLFHVLERRLLLTDLDKLRGEVPEDGNTRYMEDLCNSGALIMSCVLPPSAYFTMAVRELTRHETVCF
eukprot:symbB.v1.2.031446.t1/scaffold3649.1/size52700/2